MRKKENNLTGKQNAYCCLGYCQSHLGKTKEANQQFAKAKESAAALGERLIGPDVHMWAIHLIQCQQYEKAFELVDQEQARLVALKVKDQELDESLARCHLIIGMLKVKTGEYVLGLTLLENSERIFRRRKSMLLLPIVLHAKAEAYLRLQRWDDALRSCDEGIEIASERLFVTIHASLLILHAYIIVGESTAETNYSREEIDFAISFEAIADANHAETMANNHNLVWVQRDVHALLVSIEDATGEPVDDDIDHRAQLEMMNHRLFVE